MASARSSRLDALDWNQPRDGTTAARDRYFFTASNQFQQLREAGSGVGRSNYVRIMRGHEPPPYFLRQPKHTISKAKFPATQPLGGHLKSEQNRD
jgi:hypothetical protein